MVKRLIAGNWKMNGLKMAVQEVESLQRKLTPADMEKNDILICPPATLLMAFKHKANDLQLGGQDCHPRENGAHTGDLSAEMLSDAGASFSIVGHSERRQDHGESDEIVKAKAEAALRAGLTPIICVGESQADREAGKAIRVVTTQLEASLPATEGHFVVAYEPIWAIGTGLVPKTDDIAEMHGALRSAVGADIPLLYGGSVKPGNAGEILSIPHVNGALVGGASLKAEDFYGIISA
ncbi:MAG: triose-phosphate isomerase [Pseudomonadota bacterium]